MRAARHAVNGSELHACLRALQVSIKLRTPTLQAVTGRAAAAPIQAGRGGGGGIEEGLG